MRILAGLLVASCLLPLPAQSATIWVTWGLDLQGHAPPQSFLLSVTSPTGMATPGAMTIPWAACTTIPGAQHCAPIGCPPAGTYDFTVQAAYAEGLSAPSIPWRCTTTQGSCVCSESGTQVASATQGARATPVVATVAQPPPVHVPEGLTLLPVGPLPTLPEIPAIPASTGT